MLGRSSFRGISSPVGYLYSKRGCNVGCTFCSTPIFNPREDAIALDDLQEALDVYQEKKVAHVIIYDESFFLMNNLANLVFDALAERDLAWICLTRADLIRGRIGELTDRCMDGAIIGIESYKDANHADVRKRDDVYNVRETVRELNHYGRRVMGTFIVGFERDSIKDMETDVKHLAEEGLFACQLTLLTPFHGTKLYSQMEHLINEPDLSKFDLYNLVWKHPKMTAPEARDFLAWAQKHVNAPSRIALKIKKDLKAMLRKKLQARTRPAVTEVPSQQAD
jgi:radical SAM superfamily enzyme YgiQ (UPF0313 family)